MNKPEYKKRYRIRNAAKVKEASAVWYQLHKDIVRARKKAYRAAHREQIAEYNRKYFKNHQAALTRKRTELRHREIINESGKAYVTREA
jgi:hypothetical protein